MEKIKETVDLSLSPEDFIRKYGRKKQFSTETLGCRTNMYETNAIEEMFMRNGYDLVDIDENSDLCIINTCSVTNISDRKSRQAIRKARKNNPNAIIAVVGCYSQAKPEEIEKIQGVNLIFGTNNRLRILEEVEKIKIDQQKVFVEDIMQQKIFDSMSISKTTGNVKAYIKIQEGCDRYCSYCIIPYTRGRVRSRPIEDIIQEVKHLALNGYKEVVLTGIHVASYGKDLKDVALIDVIEKISQVQGIKRISIGSIEPVIVTDEFMQRLKNVKEFCPHFHLSMQSGSNSVLKRMNRRYTKEEFKASVEKIRQTFDKASITTDVIVGFPQETDEEFNETYEYLKDIKLYETHIFQYSQREGTKAAAMKGQVDPKVKHERSQELIKLNAQNKLAFEKNYIGKTLEVLFETTQDGFYTGYSENYIKIHCKSEENLIGKIKTLVVESVDSNKVLGTIKYS